MKLVNKFAALLLCPILFFIPTGCTDQSTVSALVTTLGNAAASIASLEGNTSLAQQLQTDTAAASQAVLNWKSGTSAQNVVQAALNAVQGDLDLISQIPGAQQYAPLISLAIGTVVSIIEIVNPSAVATAQVRTSAKRAPKNSKEFTKDWNALAVGPLAKAAIK